MGLMGNGARRLVPAIQIAVKSVLLSAGLAGWASAITVGVGWAGETVGPLMRANPGAPRWLLVCGLVALFLGAGTWIAGAVVWGILSGVIGWYNEDLVIFWVTLVGVCQYLLGVVVLVAGLSQRPLWVAAVGWTALAAITTPVVCLWDEPASRRRLLAWGRAARRTAVRAGVRRLG